MILSGVKGVLLYTCCKYFFFLLLLRYNLLS